MFFNVKTIKEILIIFLVFIIIFLFFDFLFGKIIVDKFYWKDKETFRTTHPVYHHTIKKNFDGFGFFGGTKYRFCSNSSGFKDSCNNVNKHNKFYDIGFIGDSYTEGLGLSFEDTFVGIISQKLKDIEIANLGVSTYSPSIYLAKIKQLLKEGYYFNEIIVYIDVSDVFDEAVRYKIRNEKIIKLDNEEEKNKINYLKNKSSNNIFFYNIKKFLRNNFTFTYENLHLIKMLLYRYLNKGTFPYVTDLKLSSWTYDDSTNGYGDLGIEGGIKKSLNVMDELYKLLKKNGISLSVGIYPWPGQIFYDSKDSLQVKIWENFCQLRCKGFYNNFPVFFDSVDKLGKIETYYKYFIYRDVHFNRNGNELIAENFFKKILIILIYKII